MRKPPAARLLLLNAQAIRPATAITQTGHAAPITLGIHSTKMWSPWKTEIWLLYCCAYSTVQNQNFVNTPANHRRKQVSASGSNAPQNKAVLRKRIVRESSRACQSRKRR